MIGLTSVTFRKLNFKEIVDLCVEEGIDFIEWGSDIHVKVGDFDNAEKVAQYTKKNAIDCYSYGSYYKVGQESNSKESFLEIIKTAKVLGCKLIRIWAGEMSPEDTKDEYYEKVISHIKQIADLAQEYDLVLGLEYHRNTLTQNANSSLKLIKNINKKNVKLYWQMNPEITHEQHLNEIKILRNYLCNIHVFYWGIDEVYELQDKKQEWADFINQIGIETMHFAIEFVKGSQIQSFRNDVKTLKELLYES